MWHYQHRAALLCALVLCFSAPLLAQGAPTSSHDPQQQTSEQKLARLQVIFARLEAISLQLDSKLAISEDNSAKLSIELGELKAELSRLREELAEHKQKLMLSEEQSANLEEMLAKSEASLARAEQSFGDYKLQAENKIAALSIEVKAYKTAGGIMLAVAALAGGYFCGHALGAW